MSPTAPSPFFSPICTSLHQATDQAPVSNLLAPSLCILSTHSILISRHVQLIMSLFRSKDLFLELCLSFAMSSQGPLQPAYSSRSLTSPTPILPLSKFFSYLSSTTLLIWLPCLFMLCPLFGISFLLLLSTNPNHIHPSTQVQPPL